MRLSTVIEERKDDIGGNKMKHFLKIQPQYFNAVLSGAKTFEIRKNDRHFQLGDTLFLQEFDTETQEYTGDVVERKITYITDYAQQENHVVMAII
jgi:ASC-1-like (ASCH) protein